MSTTRAAESRIPFLDSNPITPETVVSAYALRDGWLRRGLCAEPSDRTTAEAAVTELYWLLGVPRPEFVWVPSPSAAVTAATARGLRCETWSPRIGVPLPMAGRIATLLSASRHRMDLRIAGITGRWDEAAATARPPGRGLVAPEHRVRATIRDPLRTSLLDGAAAAIRTLIPDSTRAGLGVPWYGQQEAFRVGLYDVVRRTALAHYGSDDDHLLDIQAALAGATGWWWSFDEVCVMSERPTALHSEPTPAGEHNERRLHHRDRPALEFADGAAVHVLHGTIVPDWVVREPSAERIGRERNIEIRRSAIERIGWDAYLGEAELTLVAAADDPGNPGATLRLYEPPPDWGRRGRLLVAVNGSVERDGHRRRYGLHVPAWIDDPVAAAGWTYGLSGVDYSRLVRRT